MVTKNLSPVWDILDEHLAFLEKEQQEVNKSMSLQPLEEQLEYFLKRNGWNVIDTSPPDEDEVAMYVKATRMEGRNFCEVPVLPCHRLELLYVENDIFVFSVLEKTG